MGSKGLTKELIVAEAVALIRENQRPELSLHELARRLGIKAPSLYNHIKSTKELQQAVFQCAIDEFVSNQKSATEGKHRDEAVRAFATAYFSFAAENKGLYKLIMTMPSEEDDIQKEMAVPLLSLVVSMLSEYSLPDESIAHWQRVFRAILHGFISQELMGYFYYYEDIDLKKSQDIAVQCFIDGIHSQTDSHF